MKKNLVSVIIPVYNTEKYLRECLDSIVNQTLKDIEIIIVNDGSTDNSLEIINEYAEKDSRIYVVNIPNRGPSIARNVGMSKASGEYIYFIDSDDILSEEALESCYYKCVNNDLELLFFDGKTFSTDNMTFDTSHSKGKRCHLYEDTIYKGTNILSIMMKDMTYLPTVYVLFIKQSYLRDIKLFFHPYILFEDELFTFILYLKAHRVGLLNKDFYNRRVRPNSIMTSRQEESLEGYLYVCRGLHNYTKYTDTTSEEKKILKMRIKRLILIFLRRTYSLPKETVDKMLLRFGKELRHYYGKRIRLRLYAPELYRLLFVIRSR